jgi:hypothetical protein
VRVKLQGIQPADVVQLSIMGRLLYAIVTSVDAGRIHFQPLCPGAGWRSASARQVVGHWRKAGRRATSVLGGALHDHDAQHDRPA